MNKMLICEEFNEKLVLQMLKILETGKKDEDTFQKVKYTLSVLLSEAEKIIGLCIVYGIFHCIGEFLTAFFSLAALRVFTGGSHKETMIRCFLQSIFNFTMILLIGKNYPFAKETCTAIFCIWIAVTWLGVPVQSSNRIQYNKTQRAVFKAKTLSVLLVLKMLEVVIPEGMYNIVMAAMLLQLVEVAIICVKYNGKEKRKYDHAFKRKNQ